MSEPTTSARRYNLVDLLHVINEIDTTTAQAHLTSTDTKTLKQHTALRAILKQQEQNAEQATLSLITSPAPNLASQAIRPPVSRFARTMWGRGSGSESGKDMVEIRDFAEAEVDGDIKQKRFETERERQLYYRPKEWRRRRRGEWADTGLRSA